MAKKIIQAQMQQRRDTKANWASKNPVLLAGELGIVSDDPNLYKVGDGTSEWNSLPFRGFDGTLVHTTGDSETTAMSQKGVTEELAKLSAGIYGNSGSLEMNITGYHQAENDLLAISISTGEAFEFAVFNGTAAITQYRLMLRYKGASTLVQIGDVWSTGQYHKTTAAQEIEAVGVFISSSWVSTKGTAKISIKQEGVLDLLNEDVGGLKAVTGVYENGEEYVYVLKDNQDRLLFGIQADGSVKWQKGIPSHVKEYIASLDIFQTLNLKDSAAYEGMAEVTTDAENKLLSWRDADGVRHETKMKIENDLQFSKNAMSSFISGLIEGGFTLESPIDFSNKTSISLPIPRYCAIVNIISPVGLATTKTQNIRCELEYLDKSGNYFRKPIILNAQGSSSMSYIEKNQSIDMYNDIDADETCEITFGNWIAQDSFHLKCYYIDVFRGISNVGYNWAEELIQAMDSRNNRVIFNRESITANQSTGDFAADFTDGALCHPDGFPFEMYINGEYYGLYAWNLKKHRKNYSMNKNDYSALLLDGKLDTTTFFGGNINWREFELRNPKTLVTMTGAKYDGETPQELIDSTSSAYDAANDTHVKTAQAKARVERLANALPQIIAADDETAKSLFESHFDLKGMMCYFIGTNVLYHYDGLAKNWIWTIYDTTASPSFYDMDSLFGRDFRGLLVVANSQTNILGVEENTITGQLVRLYKSELDAEYKSLRESGVISVENIMSYLHAWLRSATYAALERNIEKWTSIPSYRSAKNMDDGSDEGGMFDSPRRVEKWLKARIAALDEYFNLK